MTIEPLSSTWARDFALLRSVAPILDEYPGRPINPRDVDIDSLGMTFDEAKSAGMALLDGGYITAKPVKAYGGIMDILFTGVTERGRRAVGLWPSDDLAASLIAALKAAEESPNTPEPEKSKLRSVREGLGTVSKDVVSGVIAALISGAIS